MMKQYFNKLCPYRNKEYKCHHMSDPYDKCTTDICIREKVKIQEKKLNSLLGRLIKKIK